ncbi:MAG: ATP-binding cassette domain-containing protein [Candidatus Latescibacteria bacterium]|nr:ATP-binding cassette domain-containing protein [Candidatus Latescibacterota bacterium]
MRVELNHLSLAYGEKPPLFTDLNLILNDGDFILITGPSGSGKSSLLRLINILHAPIAGFIHIDDLPIDQHEVTRLRRRIGYIQQVPVMLPGTVRENLHLPFRFKTAKDQSAPDDPKMRDSMDGFLLQDVGLADDASQLSVGQKQRLSLIRTMLTRPEVILCDEPTSALDPESKSVVEEWIIRLNTDSNTTILMVSHQDFTPAGVNPQRYILSTNGLSSLSAT